MVVWRTPEGDMSIVDDVTDCVILHYDKRFHKNDILSDTNIKTRFNFSASSWAAEAEALSELGCIKDLKVRIPQSSMNANTTPERIGRLVEKLVKTKLEKAALTAKIDMPSTKKKKKKKRPRKTARKKPRKAGRKKKVSKPR
jgi:hypothetical protein